jgi:hypothetical protein
MKYKFKISDELLLDLIFSFVVVMLFLGLVIAPNIESYIHFVNVYNRHQNK